LSNIIKIYTDGSCNPKFKIGGWASIILFNDHKFILQGISSDTTHNGMELFAVISSINYIENEFTDYKTIIVYTDSQYVVNIPQRQAKLTSKLFLTKQGNLIQNSDLVKNLIHLIQSSNIELVKVKAHQKSSSIINYNREVDILCRKIVRQQINK